MIHGNSHQNLTAHFLYEIRDNEAEETFKFGITDDKPEPDGLPKRVRKQLQLLNLAAGWERFSAAILRKNIPGRQAAEREEDEFIEAFELNFGQMPRGNLKRNRKR